MMSIFPVGHADAEGAGTTTSTAVAVRVATRSATNRAIRVVTKDKVGALAGSSLPPTVHQLGSVRNRRLLADGLDVAGDGAVARGIAEVGGVAEGEHPSTVGDDVVAGATTCR